MWNENHVDGEGEDEGSARDVLHQQRATGSTEFQTSSIQPLHAESERVVLISQSYDEDRGDEGNELGEALLAGPPSSQRRNRFRFSVPFSTRDDSRWLSRPLQVLQQMNPGMNRQASSVPPDDEPSWWISRPIELLQQMNPGMNRQAARRMLRTVGDYLAYGTLLTMFICFPMVLYRALSNRNLDLAAWNSAGVMVCGTLVLSSRQVYLHLTHWYMPEVQKYIVRIMCMPPIYSIQSWLSLRFHESRLYMDSIRDLYEAFVIASFVYYLIELLGGQEALIQILLQKREAGSTLGRHPFPLRLILQPWELGVEFMLQCKHGVLQYVLFKTIATLLVYFFELTGTYCEGTFSWKAAYPYMCFFQNISVMYALYCLVMLYSAVKDELEYPVNWRPLGKFLCIKGVIFFTWWQSVIIFYLRAHGIIGNVGDWTSRDVAYGLIDYCVVLEMVGFAIAHSYTFAYTEYLPGSVPTPEMICQQQHQQENEAFAEASETGQCADNARSRNASLRRSRDVSSYRPPATLEQPMKFRDALWSSTMPRETIQDIQRLRTGFDSALQEVRRDAGISLPEVAIRSDLELHDEGEDHVEEDEANEDEGDDVGRDDDPDDRPAVSFV